MKPMGRFLEYFFKVEKGEGKTFFLLSLFIFMTIGGNFVIGRTVSRALFLSSLPTEAIPYRYIAVTIGVVFASTLYARIANRYQRDRLIVITILLLVAGILIFRVLLTTAMADSLWMMGGLFVFLEVAAMLIIVQFWTMASEILNAREAKRLFTPINAFGNLGGIAAGLAISKLVLTLGTENLLLLLAAALLVCASCAWELGRIHQESLQLTKVHGEKPRESFSFSESLRDIRRTPLLLSMAAIVILMTLVTNVVDYQFDLSLQANFSSNGNGMSSFLGSFYFWAGLVGFILQIVATGPVLSRFGLAISLMVLPLGFAAGSSLILASGAALWAVTLTRTSDTIFRYTVNDTSFGLLYIPIPRELRVRTKAIIDGMLKPASIGIAGLLFLFVGNLRGVSILPWSFLALGLVSVWIVFIIRARRQYTNVLAKNIRHRRFNVAAESINFHDETTVQVLKGALKLQDESQLLHALSLIREIQQVDWDESVAGLLGHPSPLVRQSALEYLGRPGNTGYSKAIYYQLNAPENEVRAAALGAYCAVEGAGSLPVTLAYLEDPEPEVRAAAVAGALKYGNPKGAYQAASLLKAMTEDQNPEKRLTAAAIIARIGSAGYSDELRLLIHDPEIQVRNRALVAAGEVQDYGLLPDLLAQSAEQSTRASAVQAMQVFGAGIVGELREIFADPDLPLPVRRQIPKVLGRIFTEDAASVLTSHMDETDEHTRARVYKGLVRLQSHNVGVQMDPVDLNSRIHYEILQAYRLVVIRTDLAGYCSEHLIEDALKRQQSYAIDRVFYLLGLSYPGGKMASIQSTLVSTDGRKKANALELIDTTVKADIKRSLLPILEGSEEQVLSIATGQLGLRRKEPEYWLEELIRGSNPWMTACALFEMGTRETQKLDSILQWSCKADNPLVRETALLALWRHQSLIRTKVNEESTLRNVNHVILAEGNGKDAMREEENRMEATLSTIERVLFLRGIDLFSELPGEEVAVIAQVCGEEYIPAGERFITQGDPGDRLYVIVDGEVIVEIEGVGEVARRHSRHIIGEMAIISDNPRSAHCTAVTDVTALSIQHDDFWDLMGERPKLSLGVIKVLSSLLDETVSQIYRLGL